jgi:hypothetical protein
MTYTVNRGVIESEVGIPECPRWFSDSRLSFQMDENAITQVDYHNPLAYRGNNTVFLQRLWDGFRTFAQQDLTTLKLRYEQSKIWPFGVESQCRLAGVEYGHRVLAIGESIVFQLITPATIPSEMRFKLEFYKAFALKPADEDDLRFSDRGAKRRWREWEIDAGGNGVYGSYQDSWSSQPVERDEMEINNKGIVNKEERDAAALHIGISADFKIVIEKRPHQDKYILRSEEPLKPNKTYSFVVAFAPERQDLDRRMGQLLGGLKAAVEAQFERYRKVSDGSPELISPFRKLNDFMALAPMYHESCKVTDVPGAIKAKNTMYWVWGWDGMTSNYASFYWGDHEFMRDMLRFYEQTADPEYGVAHSYRHDMALNSVSALPAQSMYISLLHQYYAATGDLTEVQGRYPFAKRIFESILKREVQGTGLCEEASLFPDFPVFMLETGQDISSMNNTIWYCAVRSMEAIAELSQDKETARKAKEAFQRIERHFLPLFFDEERKFVVSSVDSVTLERRDSFNSNALKWENHYCAELLRPVDAACLDFFEQHVVCKAGLREIPVWSRAFDMDANQLHCWWPVTGEYYMRLINGQDRADLIEQWVGWVSYWTGKLTCPEGISCYIDTDEPDVDRWNSMKGAWHAYSVRGWYQAAIHGVVGVGMEAGGLTFYPYSGEEMTLNGLRFLNRIFDIEMKGSGSYIEMIEVGGAKLRGTNKLPADAVAGGSRVHVTVHRTAERPYPVMIKEGYGAELWNYGYRDGIIRAVVRGAGTCRLALDAARAPIVLLDGHPGKVDYDHVSGYAIIQLTLAEDRAVALEIR